MLAAVAAALALAPALPLEPTEPPPETWIPLIADRKGASVLAATTPLEPIDVSLLYFMNAKKRFTRFATLSVTSAKGGTVKLSTWLRKRLKTGATLTIAVTRPGMKAMTKTLTMRPERRPRIVTKSGS